MAAINVGGKSIPLVIPKTDKTLVTIQQGQRYGPPPSGADFEISGPLLTSVNSISEHEYVFASADPYKQDFTVQVDYSPVQSGKLYIMSVGKYYNYNGSLHEFGLVVDDSGNLRLIDRAIAGSYDFNYLDVIVSNTGTFDNKTIKIQAEHQDDVAGYYRLTVFIDNVQVYTQLYSGHVGGQPSYIKIGGAVHINTKNASNYPGIASLSNYKVWESIV